MLIQSSASGQLRGACRCLFAQQFPFQLDPGRPEQEAVEEGVGDARIADRVVPVRVRLSTGRRRSPCSMPTRHCDTTEDSGRGT